MTKYFGTDGIRGRVGEGVITPDFVLKLGCAIGSYLKQQNIDGKAPTIVIGKDTRISGYLFESALEAGLVASGCNVLMLGPMPTPGVAYLTRTFNADLGVVISASHNPYYDNGVKFFCRDGKKLSDKVEQEIENLVERPMQMVSSDELGKVRRIDDAAGRYIEFCKSTVPNRFNLRSKKIVVDCAHGATYHIAPNVFRELGAEVVAIGVMPDGININQDLGSTDTRALQQLVLQEQADVGIAFDGDGDRVIFVDANGKDVDGDELAYVIACDQNKRSGCKGVVGTLMTNLGIEQALHKQNIPFARAQVGDRYVKEMMVEKNWELGAESSGHIICADVTTTGDGIVAALKVLTACFDAEQPLHELCAHLRKFPQRMINIPLVDKNAWQLGTVAIEKAVGGAERQLGKNGRVLLRASGTEPLLRVMVEGKNEKQVHALAQSLAEDIQAALQC